MSGGTSTHVRYCPDIQVPESKIVYQHEQSLICESSSDSRFDVESQKITVIMMPNFPSRVQDEVAAMTIPGANTDDKFGIVKTPLMIVYMHE